MLKRLTVDDFISRARAIHGDKYDYSNVKYVNSKTKVKIICPIHGEFEQKPEKHWIGHGCPQCSNARVEETNLKKYGVRRPIQNKEIHDKLVQTNIDRYGVKNVAMLDDVKDKMKQTCQERYGVDYSVQAEDVKAHREATNVELYGGISPFSSNDVRKKASDTIKTKYGVDNVVELPDIQAKIKSTCQDRYGVDNPLQSDVIRDKILQTFDAEYGGRSPFVSEDIRRKSIETNLVKYGVKNPMQCSLVQDKINMSKRKNGTFNSSKSEDVLYDLLVGVFGKDDVKRQFSSSVYPFNCDFYIASRDMYIELNASWTHGRYWFDSNSEKDKSILMEWKNKNTSYYDNAVAVWSERDLLKRETARNNDLNYVVFWDSELRDAAIWFAMNCPDGHDYADMYSWLPKRLITHSPKCPSKLTISPFNNVKIAKHYQFNQFYKNEIALWNDNSLYKTVLLQIYLYYNRLMYLGKTPDMLSDVELMRSFTISGVRKGFTSFNSELMNKVIDKYDVKSVYDPCAGWGERMLCAAAHDVEYHGVDINDGLKSGYEQMIKDFCLKKQNVKFGDSATVIVSQHYDAVITCPPYGSIEKYTDYGAENLSHNDFIKWWDRVVKNTLLVTPRLFCFQINTKYRDEMLSVVENYGYCLVDEFSFDHKQSSHFTKKNGVDVKKEKETMLVLSK